MPRFSRSPVFVTTLVALAVFAVTLGGTFIYDDVAVVVTDKRLGPPIDWHGLWTESYNAGVDNLYRPLVSSTYAIERLTYGLRPMPYHAVNWLLHALVSGLVAWVAGRFAERGGLDGKRSRAVAWIAGVLFAAHPIHVEAVANVVGRAELMCAAGTLVAIGVCLSPLTRSRVAIAFVGFLVAMLSKEQGMLVPLLAGAAWWLAREPANVDQKRHAATLFALMTLGVASMVVLRENVLHLKFWWARSFLDPWIQPLVDVSGGDRLITGVAIAGRYLQLLVAPVTLRIDYGGDIVPGVTRVADPYLWLGVLAIAAWVGLLIFAARRRDRALGAALVSFALVYGMVGNLVTLIGVNVAERVIYLPSAFFLIAVALLVVRLPRRATIVGISLVAASFAARSITYAWRWNDAVRFYEYAARVEPRSLKATLLAMQARLDRGDLDAAERYGLHALSIRPAFDDTYCRLASVYLRRGDFDAAARAIARAQELNPAGRGGLLAEELAARRAATRPAP